MKCPRCNSEQIVKNGSIHTGKQKYLCKVCGRQFVENPQQHPIPPETKALINKLLLEKLPLAGIARVTGVSETWLQSYVNHLYEQVPRQAQLRSKKKRG
jgi:insertion element IS1 protein InsB